MDQLEIKLKEHNVDIISFKTDSVFCRDPKGTVSKLIVEYFEALGLGTSTYHYTHFIHGQSRNSDQDVSSYFGIKYSGEIEINGIGMKINSHLL